jgi:membrane protease YdiL (CAAX protease family)
MLLSRLVRPFAWYWLPFAFLFIPAIALGLVYIMPSFDPRWPVGWRMVAIDLPIIMIAARQILANIAPFGEELGWRGYALPLLLRETNAYLATLILGAVWIVWHVPGLFLVGATAPSLGLFAWWSLGTLALTMVMTFLFIRAGGNVVVAGIIPHFVINAAAAVGVWESRPPETLSLAGLAVILAVALLFNKTSASPAPAQR